MSAKIVFNADVASGASQYYGRLVISDIRYEDGSKVFIQQFLGLTLKSPASISEVDVTASLNPWVPTSVQVYNNQIDTDQYNVQIKVNFENAYLIGTDTSISIGVNGDLTSNSNFWTGSVALFADELPGGSSTLFRPPSSQLHPPGVFARLAAQPAALTGFIGGMIRKGFGCCFGRDDDGLDEKLPGEITLKN